MPPKRRPRAEMTPDPVSVDTLSASQEALPEAKKPKLVAEEPVFSVAPVVAVAKAAANSAIIDDGEAVEVPKAKVIASAPVLPKSAEELNPDLIDDGREVCRWDDECIRKNPLHFKEFRHPKLFEMRLAEKKAHNGSSNGYHAHASAATSHSSVPAMRRASSSGLSLTSAEVSKTTVRNPKGDSHIPLWQYLHTAFLIPAHCLVIVVYPTLISNHPHHLSHVFPLPFFLSYPFILLLFCTGASRD